MGDTPVSIAELFTNLSALTTYHYEFVASNSVGVTSSGDETFTTDPYPPAVTTVTASNLANTSATLDGMINPNGGTVGWYFEYGVTTNYGSFTPTNPLAAGFTASGVNYNITNLLPGVTYHCQLIATNAGGAGAGGDVIFTTQPLPPSLTMEPASGITTSNATLNALVNPNGAPPAVYFAYGTNTAYGYTNLLFIANGGNSNIAAATTLSNLAQFTIYHFQVSASNSAGMITGPDQTFTTLNTPLAPVAWWHMGEADPGASSGGSATLTQDSVGSNNMTVYNGCSYSSDVGAAAAVNADSSLSIDFPGNAANWATSNSPYARAAAPNTGSNNFGVELWLKVLAVSDAVILIDGQVAYPGPYSGFTIIENPNSTISVDNYANNTYLGSTPFTANTWMHLAYVVNNGVTTFYMNGKAVLSTASAPVAPAGSLWLGANPGYYNDLYGFNGLIDEVRVFTFAPGAFSTNYLLLNDTNNYPAAGSLAAVNMTTNSAVLTAIVTPNVPAGTNISAWFEYGLTASYGNNSATNSVPGSSPVSVSNLVSGLQSGTTYHFRVDLEGAGFGLQTSADATFTTPVAPPAIGNVSVPAAGSFLLQFSGNTNASYTVLGSTNVGAPLSNWSVLGIPSNVNNSYQFSDTNATNGQEFYILKQQ